LETAQIWRELAHIIFWRIVLEVAQIWRELAPHYLPADCFGGSSNLAGTVTTLFTGGLFWRQPLFFRKYRYSMAVALKEYYNYSPISTYTEICRYFRETIVTVKLLIYRKQERDT
jgi:hypothetical protein